jgi:hypothetical protein
MKFRILLKSRIASVFLGCLLLAVASIQINAQSGTSAVNGTVNDAQGQAVPNATVRLLNNEKGFSRTTTTSSEGVFSFPSIPPDTYALEVEASGFKKFVQTNVQALIDRPFEANIALEVGAVTETVNISSDAIESIVNTQDATLGNNFVERQIVELPINSRNLNELLSLQPGVTVTGEVNGGRSDQSNVTLDGVDVNDQQTGIDTIGDQGAFNSVLRLTAEAIEEFRLTTSNPNANQGRSSGAQVSLSTKSGTNNFRGALFYIPRPGGLSSNPFFNNRSGIERPPLKRDIFGGAIGGPIVKDKFFFFYSYEGFRERASRSVVRLVPLQSLGSGSVRVRGTNGSIITITPAQLATLFPGTVENGSAVNPAALAVLASAASRYTANDTTIGDGLNTGGFRFNAETPEDRNTHILRLDYNLTGNQLLFVRGNYQYDSQQLVSQFPDTPSPEFWRHPYGGVVGHNWTISSNKVNNFRYGYTRQAFTVGGDSSENPVSFRFVFSPRAFSNTLSRITPVHNFTDDFNWTVGNHNLQFGTNIRLIRNHRVDSSRSFDSAVINPSFFDESGAVLSDPIEAGFPVAPGQASDIQAAVAAVLGRFSQYSVNVNYDISGNVLPAGTPIERTFATEEYDFYGQDAWKLRPNLTLTLGLRYGLSRPVYEVNGYQVRPTRSLGEFFEQRRQAASEGRLFNEPIQFELAGPKNNKPGYYSLDKNNFQPRFAVAWSPNFKNRFLKGLFGSNNQSTIRGGFSITNDYFGQQLAVSFDQLSTLGFVSELTVAANTYGVGGPGGAPPGPRFTGFGQAVRNLPNVPSAPNRFATPVDGADRIESSLDDSLVSPINYSWNVTYGRQFGKGTYVEASYVGRSARNLLATRDIMHFNNIVDPASGQDWYTAARLLAEFRDRNTPINQVPVIPFFQNLFPNYTSTVNGVTLNSTQRVYRLVARENLAGPVGGGLNILDWTFIQTILDQRSRFGTGVTNQVFSHPQYAAFSTFSTIAKSDYHGGLLTVRQRFGEALTFDFNYTFSKSMDNASGIQASGTYGSAFIVNPLDPDLNYAVSDFDLRHQFNTNAIWQLPFGKGRAFLSNANSFVNALIGGWQLTGIFRYHSGFPAATPFDAQQWATNWNVQSNGVRIRPLSARPNRGGANAPNLFADPVAAYQSFRNALPGEVGERNIFRNPNFYRLDLGLSKSFQMPYNENHRFQFRVEAFNVTNTQRLETLTVTRQNFGLDIDPNLGQPNSQFGTLNGIQGGNVNAVRQIQFFFRYSF